MDLLGVEIHIPAEAEVKNVPVWSLPNSVLRRIGLPLPASEGSKALPDPPEGVWISPTVIRRKGQNQPSHTGNMSSLLYREFRAAQGPLQMSFVTSNCTAYKLLQDIMPGKKVSHTSHTSLLPHGTALKTQQDAIVIYRGRIYLIIRNPKRSRSQQETHEPQAAPSSLHSTAAVSSDSQEKVFHEPADKELQRKRCRSVTLAQISLKQDILTKTNNHSTTETLHKDQALLNDNKPNNKGARRKRPARFQTPADQEEVANNDCDEREIQDPDSHKAESSDHGNSMDSNMQVDYQNGNRSWSRRDPQSAASTCTSAQQACDFKELEQKEKIAHLKAKLRQVEANLHNKHAAK
ncbi:hypothetical protein PAMP_012724 [Pampus punctatissimus]